MRLLNLSRNIKRYNTVEQDAITPPDASQALVMLEQCHDVVAKIRRSTKRIGVSVSLTYMLALLEHSGTD